MAATAMALGSSARAATVTKQVLVNFNGSLSGTTYTLGAGEIDNSASFRANGGATVSGGVADIPGDTSDASGFFFNSTALGNLRTQSWVTEAHMSLDVPVASQPNVTPFNHFLDVQGDLFYRFDSNPKVTRFGFWDGANEPTMVTANPSAGAYNHVALVWDSPTRTLAAYINGASQGSVSTGNPFEVPSPNVGYGFFSRFMNRAIDGKLSAVAFSTFTGTFNPGADFQLAVIPEPGSVALLAIGFAIFTRLRVKVRTERC
jgi:hypothetical protein